MSLRKRDPFFSEFDVFFEKMHEDLQKTMNSLMREFDEAQIQELSKNPNAKVYGFSMRVGSDGKPIIREFGNIGTRFEKITNQTKQIETKRKPLTDIFQTEDEVQIVIELPGVEKKEIILDGNDFELAIKVNNEKRKYETIIPLPVLVESQKAEANYKNGILTVKIPKKKQKKDEPKKINIS